MISPARYRSHIPSHLDVIFLLPFPSVNTLQVSHIRRARIGATMVAVNGDEISKRRKRQSCARAISMPRPSPESRICLPSYFGPLDHIRRICLLEKRLAPCVLRDGKPISFKSGTNEKRDTGKTKQRDATRSHRDIKTNRQPSENEKFIPRYKCIMTRAWFYLLFFCVILISNGSRNVDATTIAVSIFLYNSFL